jgi:hypothetical protein
LVHSTIPCFDGNSDPRADIEWKLKVEKEFDEHDLSKAQLIYIASHALTEYALLEWKHICRHNNIPQYWIGFKLHFREAFIPAYYVDHLLAKLDNLNKGRSTINEYYHEFKIRVLFGSLDECKKDVMSRFMKELNSEIRTCSSMKLIPTLVTCFCLLELLKTDFII